MVSGDESTTGRLPLKSLLIDRYIFLIKKILLKNIFYKENNYHVYLATGNEIPTSSGRCGTANEMGAGGARPKELKGILAVKLKTKKKNIKSAIPEIHPAVPPKKKNIILNFSEEVRI